MKHSKPSTKDYTLQWFSLEEGVINHTKSITTSNPKMALFNFACVWLVMLNSVFSSLPMKKIMNNIQTGHTAREHYWIEYPNGEVLSIMEDIKQ